MRAVSRTSCDSSVASLDLPIPAGPNTVTSRHDSIGNAPANVLPKQVELSRSRPISGASSRRAYGDAPSITASTFHATHRAALALHGQLVARLEQHRVVDKAARVVADEDLAGARGLFEPLGDVDRVAGDEHLSTGAVAGDDLAGVDADADADWHAELALELVVQLGERASQLARRAHRAQRVVLMQLRNAEDRHHRVADELLDGAAVALERPRTSARTTGT